MCQILRCFFAKVKNASILCLYFNFWHCLTIYSALWCFLAHHGTFWHIWLVTLFCGEFALNAIYTLFQVKLLQHKSCFCKVFCLFLCLFGIFLRYFWDTFGIHLGYFLDTFWIFLGNFWDTFLDIFSIFQDIFRILW